VDYKIEINVTELQILGTHESQGSFLDAGSGTPCSFGDSTQGKTKCSNTISCTCTRVRQCVCACEFEFESSNDSAVIVVMTVLSCWRARYCRRERTESEVRYYSESKNGIPLTNL
jgi:hypothetical protein